MSAKKRVAKKKASKKIKLKPERFDKYLLLSWRKAWIIVGAWFVAVILHNIIYGLFKTYFESSGGDEAFFFIIAIIVIPLYVIIAIVYSLLKVIMQQEK